MSWRRLKTWVGTVIGASVSKSFKDRFVKMNETLCIVPKKTNEAASQNLKKSGIEKLNFNVKWWWFLLVVGYDLHVACGSPEMTSDPGRSLQRQNV